MTAQYLSRVAVNMKGRKAAVQAEIDEAIRFAGEYNIAVSVDWNHSLFHSTAVVTFTDRTGTDYARQSAMFALAKKSGQLPASFALPSRSEFYGGGKRHSLADGRQVACTGAVCSLCVIGRPRY